MRVEKGAILNERPRKSYLGSHFFFSKFKLAIL